MVNSENFRRPSKKRLILLQIILILFFTRAHAQPIKLNIEPPAPTAKQEVLLATSTPKPLIKLEVSVQHTPASLKRLLQTEFGTSSPMVEIARCESGYRQFDASGKVLRGRINPKDVGLFQISETYWLATSKKLGIDIYTLEGNIKMARHILKTQGLQAWKWSNGCHRAIK